MYDTIFKDADIYLIELIYIYKKKTLLRSLLYLYIKRRIIF